MPIRCFLVLPTLIENADATPPHLDVLVRLGDSVVLHGSLQFLCVWEPRAICVVCVVVDRQVAQQLPSWGTLSVILVVWGVILGAPSSLGLLCGPIQRWICYHVRLRAKKCATMGGFGAPLGTLGALLVSLGAVLGSFEMRLGDFWRTFQRSVAIGKTQIFCCFL